MDEILKQVRKQIEEMSGGIYYFSDTGLPYLDIYTTTGWNWVCRVRLLEKTNNYQITPYISTPRKVGKDILLSEVLKELWRYE